MGGSQSSLRRRPHETYHSTKVAARIAERSLMSHAAGRPVARVRRPHRRKVQATLLGEEGQPSSSSRRADEKRVSPQTLDQAVKHESDDSTSESSGSVDNARREPPLLRKPLGGRNRYGLHGVRVSKPGENTLYHVRSPSDLP